MMTTIIWKQRAVLLIISITATIIIGTTTSATLDENNKLENICKDGCFCDNTEPYLINCNEVRLKNLYTSEDWNFTLTNQNINTSISLDVRFNDNHIKIIPPFPSIKIVNLSFRNNWIHQIAANAFSNLDYLISLDLSYNNLTAQDLPEDVFIGKLNSSYYKPIPLQHLNMSHNNIHSIEKDLFDHLPALTSLDLSYNPIRVLGGSTSMAIATLRKLLYLNLRNSEIKTIPEGMIHDLMFLQSLDLSGNALTVVPPEVRNGVNLTVLILDNNPIESLNSESFRGLTKLRTLSISYMSSLKIIEEQTFSPLKNLLVLDCQHNRQLDKISNAAFYEIYEKDGEREAWPVKEIRFNNNAFKHIDEALAEWENVDYIDIQNNPFRCDCNLKWMTQTLVVKIGVTHPYLVKDIVCASPDSVKGNTLIDLSILPEPFSKCDTNPDEFDFNMIETPDTYHTAGVTLLTIAIILLVIALGILGVLIVKRRAIASALVAHQEIRYKRAEMDDTDSYRGPSSIRVT